MDNSFIRGGGWLSIAEFCRSAYRGGFYSSGHYHDFGFRVVKEVEPSHRVFRGGCWYLTAEFCRSASRFRYFPSYRSIDLGFRVVKETDNEL